MDDFIIINLCKKIEDPRINRNKLYPLPEILLVAFATMISGGESYADMEDFGEAKILLFKEFLPFENGIPSTDTFERVFGLINPKAFEELLLEWTKLLSENAGYKSIAIDGKTLRRSGSAKNRPLHMISAWASHNKMIVGCKTVDEKSNEISAIPEILKLLNLKDTTITTDAMGCQTEIAQQIVDQDGDFALALKGNHGDLHDDVKIFFDKEQNNDAIVRYETVEKNHGRIEKREYGLYSKIDWLIARNPQWSMVKSIGFVRSTRTIKDKKTTEIRYYIVSYKNDVKRFESNVRNHWGVENNVHWALDVTFREDSSRVRDRNAATNLAILRRIAINKLAADTTPKRSKRRKKNLAGWDDNYLKSLLFS
jgi:predicted transposase YbfD/YdcC